MIEMNFENKTFLVWFKDIYSSQHEMEFKMVQNVEKKTMPKIQLKIVTYISKVIEASAAILNIRNLCIWFKM